MRRVPPRRLIALTCLAGVIGALPAAAAAAEGGGRAVGYAALLPAGVQGAASASSTGPADRSSEVAGLRPAGGGQVGWVRVRVRAGTAGARGAAEGTVSVSDLSLLDGRVSIATLRMSARAGAAPGGASGGLSEGSVVGLVVDGRPVAAGPGSRVEVAGVGTLVLLEQVADGSGSVRANAIRVEVTDPQAAALIGQPFVIGHLDLEARSGDAQGQDPGPEPSAPPAPERPRDPVTTSPAPEAAPPDPLPPPAPLALPRRSAPAVSLPQGPGYVFPVFGEVGFSDDYGAPRAGTGWHHGNDLYAATGTPVLAVADGTLSRVGINRLGGNRLWLTDDAGNEFYYAHLSAYAPAAVQGARVSAGQVIGFVGNTGQAITTPPHLHFEVHPAGGDSVNPYPYLLAWQRGSDIALAFRQAATSSSPAPAVGAVLVDGTPEIDVPPAPDDGIATPAS
jgi:murein DD-endopeptidase MepM/ murein hydrolase activator NlpD